MSPYEQGDICIEPERATTSGGDFQMREGGVGVCQGRRTPGSERAPNQTLEQAFARRRGGGPGTRQPLYGDHNGIFVRNDDYWTVEEQLAGKRQPTQFGRAFAQLGISFIAANSPQAKGRVERLWGVLQDRLTSELRLAQAQDLDSANAVLRQFITDYNRRFARPPRQSQPAWRPAPDNLDRICCFVHERIVSNDNVVQWQGRRFQIPQQARRFSFAGAKVQIYQALDGRVSLYHGQTRLQHSALPAG